MTYEEAKEVIYEMICLSLLTPKEDEALHIAYQALEKQIPKKPTIEHYRYYDKYSCPKCNKYFLCKDDIGFFAGERSEFCDKCGQVIDWSK